MEYDAIITEGTKQGCEEKKTIKVLHVDDDAAILEISKLMLQDFVSNLDIEHANCVDEAIEKLSTGLFDIVISDYDMPQKNGLDLLKHLREQRNEIPFILFTGKGREEIAIQALNLGADGYINKQGTPDTVYGELSHCIRRTVKNAITSCALINSEEKFKKTFEMSLVGLTIFNLERDCFIDCNFAFEKMLGFVREEIVGKNAVDLNLYKNPDEQKEIIRELLRHGFAEKKSLHLVDKSGNIKLFDASFTKVEINKQNHYVSNFLDVTDRIKAEETLRKSEAKFRELANGLPEIVFEMDMAGKLTFFNRRATEIFNGEDLTKVNILDFLVPQDREKAVENIKRSMSGQDLGFNEYTLLKRNGETFSGLIHSTPIFFGNMKVGLRGLIIDITERKKAEKALQESEEKYRTTFESSRDALMLLDEHGFFDCNNTALELFGAKTVEEFASFHPADLSPPVQPNGKPSMEEAMQHINRALREGTDHFSWVHKRTDGTVFQADVLLTKTRIKSKDVLQATVRDITNLKSAERMLRESESQYKSLFSSMSEGVCLHEVIYDDNGKAKDYRILNTNPAYEKITGIKCEDARGKLASKLYGTNQPPYLEIYAKVAETGENAAFETYFPPMDKSFFISVFSPGKSMFATVFSDITERKKTDEQLDKSNQDLKLVTEKLQAVGGLTRHDVGNKLMGIKGYIYILKKGLVNQPEIMRQVEKIEVQVDQSIKLFEYSRLYEKIGSEQPSNINVAESFNQAIKLLPEISKIKITNECQSLTVLADSMLMQLFYNLIDDSLKHGKKVTEVKLSYLQGINATKVFYEDNGVGIAMENKDKIFEGFTTGGSGLGLRLVKKMIEAYGWTIKENGIPDEGARFEITITKASAY